MSYQAPSAIAAHSLLGNPTASDALGSAITLDSTLSLSGSALAFVPGTGRTVTGNATVQASDDGTSIVCSSASSSNLTLPAGLSNGFKVRSYASGAGQISYIAGAGATIVNGTPKSGGVWTSGFYADIENVGSDAWIVTGNLA